MVGGLMCFWWWFGGESGVVVGFWLMDLRLRRKTWDQLKTRKSDPLKNFRSRCRLVGKKAPR